MNQSPGSPPKSGGNWTNFFISYMLILTFTLVFQSIPPVLRLIMADLNLDHTLGGLTVGLFSLPGIFLTIPGGYLADRYGIKIVSWGALVLMAAGSVAAGLADSLAMLWIGRVVSGAGAVVLIVAAATIVSTSFRGRALGMAMGLYGTGLPLGTIISFSALGYLGTEFGWRAALLAPIAAVAASAFLLAFISEPEHNRAAAFGSSVVKTLGEVWPLALAWLWFNAAVISWLAFGPQFLISLGYQPGGANFIAGLIMWGALIVSPSIGPLLTDIRRKTALIIVGSLGAAALYFVLPALSAWVVPLIVLLGLVSALLPAPLFALPAELSPREQQGLAFGIISTSLNAGVLAGPFLVGLARDMTDSYTVGFYMMGGFSLIAALSILPVLKSKTTPDQALD